MPLSSAEVSNIIAAQISQLSGTLQYAQNISAMQGGAGAQSAAMPSHSQMAGVGGVAASAPFAALGAASMAAEFNMGPRIMAPFNATMHMGSIGMRGGGLAGALGMGAMTAGAYAGIGAGLGWMENQMMAGAQTRGMLNQQVGGIFPNASAAQLGGVSSAIEGMHRQGLGTLNELTGLMQQGIGSGALDSSSISNFQASFSKLAQNVRQVANVLNSTLNEAQSAMEAVKSMGISSDQIVNTISAMRGIGGATGLSPGQMSAVAASGAQFGTASGIDAGLAARGAMASAGMMRMAMGSPGFSGMNMGHQGRFTAAASRFLGSRYGRIALGAMMTEQGTLDTGVAAQMASGALSNADIRSMYRQRMAGGGRDLLGANQGELAASFISQFGAQGISPIMNELTSGSGRQRSLQRMLTGLTNNEMGMMADLNAATPMLQQRLASAAQEGFSRGSRQQTLSQALNLAFDKLSAPVRDAFQKLGANITQSITEQTEALTRQFVGGGGGAASSGSAIAGMGAMQSLSAAGNQVGLSAFKDIMRSGGMERSVNLGISPSGDLSTALPSILSLSRFGSGTDLSELPLYGLGSSEMSYGAMGAGMLGAARFGGKNIVSHAGSALWGVGRAGMRAFGGGGMTGLGLLRGTGAMAGTLTAGAGALLRGAGGLLGAGAGLLFAGGFGVNAVPEIMRRTGNAPITAGAISGYSADSIRDMASAGLVEMSGFSPADGPGNLRPLTGPLRDGYQDALAPNQIAKVSKIWDLEQKAKGKLSMMDSRRVNRAARAARTVADTATRVETFARMAGVTGTQEEMYAAAAAAGVVQGRGESTVDFLKSATAKEVEEETTKILRSKLGNNYLSEFVTEKGGAIPGIMLSARLSGNNPEIEENLQDNLYRAFEKQGVPEGNRRGLAQLLMSDKGIRRATERLGFFRKYEGVGERYMRAQDTMRRENELYSDHYASAAGSVGISADVIRDFANSYAENPGDPATAGRKLTGMIQDADLGTADQIRLASNLPSTGAGSLAKAVVIRHAQTQQAGARYGKSPEKFLNAIGIHGALTSREKRFFKSDTSILPARLYDHLTVGVRQMMLRSMSEEAVTGAAVAANVDKIITGLQDLRDGRADSNAKEMYSALANMGVTRTPGSGQSQTKDFSNALGEMTQTVKGATAAIREAFKS